ncbi:MAG TPA: hypothetical protein VES03_00140 [Motilibacterales bacterium]|nr:hypothetical protein [Motilibacterales bacterium]
MSTPAPRPALKKAADAHIHPAAPGHALHTLRPAADGDPSLPEPGRGAEPSRTSAPLAKSGSKSGDAGQHRLSGPLRGTTSDSLRAAAKTSRSRPSGRAEEKPVDLGVKVPKSVRKDFRAAAKADKKDPDAVVTALLKAWLGT